MIPLDNFQKENPMTRFGKLTLFLFAVPKIFQLKMMARLAGLAGLACLAHTLSYTEAGAAPILLPPFPPGIVYPVDMENAPAFSGATLIPSHPVFYFSGVPGWIQGKKVTNSMKVTIPKYEMMVIRGSMVRGNTVVIPAGGVYFDSSPARGELPMTGSKDFFFGKRYYFVDYDARIHVRKDAIVRTSQPTSVGNHLYTLVALPIPKVVPEPVINWRTYDGVSIRPWAFSIRWQSPSAQSPDQKPMTYLQGVIRKVDPKAKTITFSSLTGSSIHSEWWARSLVFEGTAKAGEKFLKNNTGIVIDRIDDKRTSVTFHFIRNGKIGSEKTLISVMTPSLPENASVRKKMIAIDGSVAVVLWPHDAISNASARLWVYSGVEHWTTNRSILGFDHMAYFPIACPIAHHIGAMVYNTRPIILTPRAPVALWDGYAKIEVVSIKDQAVQFKITSKPGTTPTFKKTGNIDAVIGEGRAAHGILSTLDATDLDLDRDLSVKN
jgi:hypothetical protein